MKPGYKQTEIGVIPEDWEVYTLSDICIINPFSTRDFPKEFFYIDLESVSHGKLIEKRLIEKINAPSRAQRQFMAGDILYQTVRPYQKNNLFISFDATKYIASTGYAVIRANKSITSRLLYQILHTDRFTSVVLDNCSGTGYPAINPKVLSSLKIAIPTKVIEQQCIAKALSDLDEMIASLEKLIAKKKAIKQGAMQELLTGKRRLPGFSGEWKSKAFGDLFLILPNNSFSREQLSLGGRIKNIHYGDILTKYGACLDGSSSGIPTLEKSLEKKGLPEKSFVQNGDVIIADTAEDLSVGKAVEMLNVSGKVLSGQHTFFCRPVIPFAPMYLGYYLNSEDFHDQMIPFVTGTKVSSINKTALCGLRVRYPDLAEQRVIAEVLSDMDKNISIIEQRLRKALQSKQGMMQQLLTGKIRLN